MSPFSRTNGLRESVSLIPQTPQETVKAILVIAVTLFAALRASLSDDVFSPVEGVQLVIQAATLIPVFLLSGVVLKTIAAFVLAGLQFLVPAVTSLAGWQAWGSLTFDDYAGAILAAMLAIGIAVVPNAPAPAPVDVVVVAEADTSKPSYEPAERDGSLDAIMPQSARNIPSAVKDGPRYG